MSRHVKCIADGPWRFGSLVGPVGTQKAGVMKAKWFDNVHGCWVTSGIRRLITAVGRSCGGKNCVIHHAGWYLAALRTAE